MRRREFITLLSGAIAWPVRAHAQQPALPVVALVNLRSAEASARVANAFRKGLNEAGYAEGQNVIVEYHWLDERFDRLSSVMADVVRRRVAVIATPGGNYASQVAKAATTTIPIETAFFRSAECLLLAQSGHASRAPQCLLLGVKRTLVSHSAMSAFDPKRTFGPFRSPISY